MEFDTDFSVKISSICSFHSHVSCFIRQAYQPRAY